MKMYERGYKMRHLRFFDWCRILQKKQNKKKTGGCFVRGARRRMEAGVGDEERGETERRS